MKIALIQVNKMIKKYLSTIIILSLIFSLISARELAASFDLRNVDSLSFVSPVRLQQGGTCWAHAVMASMESNMMRTEMWDMFMQAQAPDLAEYHLDWWSGFNLYYNEDLGFSPAQGLEVHMGGDYRVASVYFSRGDGAVLHSDAPSYEDPPSRWESHYTYYYPRHIEWFTLQDDLSNLSDLKRVIMDHGAVGTCMYVGMEFLDDSTNGSFYQPPSDLNDPNHAIAIVGWNDTITTAAPFPGAWLCKNSWGEGWGANWQGNGYFWISYYDKHAARHPEMGFISFRDVELMDYDKIYYHDYHGWRDELEDIDEAANIFVAGGNDTLTAVSFFTAADSVNYRVNIFRGGKKAINTDPVFFQEGFFARTGFHTVDLREEIALAKNDSFIVSLVFDRCAYPYDKTSEVPVLLDIPNLYKRASIIKTVPSIADKNESLFKVFGQWFDLQYLNESANFCIKALVKQEKVESALQSSAQGNSFSIYPNPSSGRISLSFDLPASAKVKISLYDLRGNLIRVVENKTYSLGYNLDFIDLLDLSNGLYICVFELDGKIADKQKIMVFR